MMDSRFQSLVSWSYPVYSLLWYCWNIADLEHYSYPVLTTLSLFQQVPAQGGLLIFLGTALIILIAVGVGVKSTTGRLAQARICKNRTILILFISVLLIYFMCYTSIWMQVFDFSGSFHKRQDSDLTNDKHWWSTRVVSRCALSDRQFDCRVPDEVDGTLSKLICTYRKLVIDINVVSYESGFDANVLCDDDEYEEEEEEHNTVARGFVLVYKWTCERRRFVGGTFNQWEISLDIESHDCHVIIHNLTGPRYEQDDVDCEDGDDDD